jgi:hypothetical protein
LGGATYGVDVTTYPVIESPSGTIGACQFTTARAFNAETPVTLFGAATAGTVTSCVTDETGDAPRELTATAVKV